MVSDGLIKWLCHDLATPVATVLTASELLGPDEDQEIRDMVTGGAKRLAARLRLIRAALAPGETGTSGPALARSIAEGTGVACNWDGGEAMVDAATASALAGLALLLEGTAIDLDGASIASHGRPPGDTVLASLTGAAAPDSRAALALTVAMRARAAGLRFVVDTGVPGATRIAVAPGRS